MPGLPLYSTHPWAVGGGILVLLLLAVECGDRVARWRRGGAQEAAIPDLETIYGAVLALLGLLLAFTYSFAAERHDARRELVVREANAIGTAVLRSQLVPEPGRGELVTLLRQYLDSRLIPDEDARDPARLAAAFRRTDEIQARLWPAAVQAVQGHPPTDLDGILLESINDVINLDTDRRAAATHTVPGIVFLLLLIVAVMAMLLTGISAGLRGRRQRAFSTTLALLTVMVIYVILDLISPRGGFIRVSQQSLVQLNDRLEAADSSTGGTPSGAPR